MARDSHDDEAEMSGEYTRVRANVQIGDGPDQRGDVTVEIQRHTTAERTKERVVEIPNGSGYRTEADDQIIAELYLQTQRAQEVLADVLGLEGDA